MAQFSARIAKLLLESGKQSVAGDAFIAHEDREAMQKLGEILGILELFALPEDFVNGFFEIISDLKTEYYLPPLEVDGGVEKRFEECLQRANRRLDKLIQASPFKIELQNINVLIGLIHRQRIFLAQIGKTNAFLFHRKKRHESSIIDIFGQTTEKKTKIDQEKMFPNVVSGAISEKDSLLFCNDAILEYLSQNELLEIITENPAETAIHQLEQSLETQAENNNFYAIIVQPEPEANKEPAIYQERASSVKAKIIMAEKPELPSQHSIDKLIDTQANTEKYLTPSIIPNWQKVILLIWLGVKKTGRLAGKWLAILTQELLKLANELFRLIRKKLPLIASAAKDGGKELIAEPKTFAKNLSRQSASLAQNAIQKATEFDYHKFIPNNSLPGQGLAEKISNWLNCQIEKFVGLNKIQKILLIAAFALIFFFSQSIVWRGQNDSAVSTGSVAEIMKQIEDAVNTAGAQNIFNDEIGAQVSLAKADESLAQLPKKMKYKSFREDIGKRIADLKQLLQKVAYLQNPLVISDLANKNASAQTAGLAKIGNVLFVFDQQNKNLNKIDINQKQVNNVPLAGAVDNVKKIVALDDKNILILNGDKDFYKYSLNTGSTTKALTAGGAVKDFTAYGGKLYTLQPDKNQIYKHFPAGGGFNAGSAWLKAGVDIKSAVAIAVDGGIYALKDNGEIQYFETGKAKETSFSVIDPAISQPIQIHSEMESNYVYVLDPKNQRLAVFEKKGNLKIQYTSKEFNDLKAMAVAEKEKKIYVLNGNKVLLIEINF